MADERAQAEDCSCFLEERAFCWASLADGLTARVDGGALPCWTVGGMAGEQ